MYILRLSDISDKIISSDPASLPPLKGAEALPQSPLTSRWVYSDVQMWLPCILQHKVKVIRVRCSEEEAYQEVENENKSKRTSPKDKCLILTK